MNSSIETGRKLSIKNGLGRRVFIVFNYFLLSLVTAISLIPILNVLSKSFSSNIYVNAGEVFLWPRGVTLEAYKYVMANKAFYNSFMISIEVVTIGVTLTLLVTILTAYPLSKEKEVFRGRSFFAWFFLLTMIFNGGVVPWFMVVKYTGLYNTIWAIVVPSAFQAFYVLLLLNYIRGLPKELEEAAFIDGAGHIKTLISVILPLSKPVLATITLFCFVGFWNDWFSGYLFMRTSTTYPLQTYLYSILQIPDVSQMDKEQLRVFMSINRNSIKAAEIFVSTIPIFIVYPFLQKYFTKGIVLGSVKG